MDYIVAILGSCGSSKDVYCTLQENYPGTPAVFINDLSQCKEGHFVVHKRGIDSKINITSKK